MFLIGSKIRLIVSRSFDILAFYKAVLCAHKISDIFSIANSIPLCALII